MDNMIGKLFDDNDETSSTWILVLKSLVQATSGKFTKEQIIQSIKKCKTQHKNSKTNFIKCVKNKLGLNLDLGGPKNP
jgi:hypothetical protein